MALALYNGRLQPMSSLIVILPAPGSASAAELRFVLTPEGRSVGSHGSAAAALLPAASGEIVALAPASALSWHQVDLPRGVGPTSARLRVVLEGLLEDRLLDEPETLHFALQPQPRAGTPAWVAVCDRAWLRSAVQAIESAGRRVSRIVPEFAPDGPPAMHVLGEPDAAHLVVIDAGITLAPFTATTAARLSPAVDSADAPVVLAEPAVAALAEQWLKTRVTLQQSAQRWLLAAQTSWDLAQFDLASSGGRRAFRRISALGRALWSAPQWKAARWGLAALVAVNLLGLNAWAWKERTALDGKQAAVRDTLLKAFPSVKVVVDAPLQMERELAALRQSTGAASAGDIEAILSAVSLAVPINRTVSAIEYSEGEARIRGAALNAAEAAALDASLRAQGYAPRIEGDTLRVRPLQAQPQVGP